MGLRRRRTFRRAAWTAGVAALLAILLGNNWVISNTEAYIYDDWSLLPDNDVGLVLGTSSYARGGDPNPQFYGRVKAAADLYQIGKVRHLIVSGANPDATYNEPRRMWQELIKLGVPPKAITMDFAGFRTFDSVARAQTVFGLKRLTIITQRYHAYRAVFIAKKLGIIVVGYAAPGAEYGPGPYNYLREMFARVKAILDIYLLRTQPKYLGTPERIEVT